MATRTNLSALALRHRTLTVFFMIALVAAGIYAFFSLGRAEDPPFTIKQMVVSAAWPGATSREMEQQVTEKIETKLQELPFFNFVNSYTKPGETVIYVSLRDDTAAILSGVKDGEWIATAGVHKLEAGQRVKPMLQQQQQAAR